MMYLCLRAKNKFKVDPDAQMLRVYILPSTNVELLRKSHSTAFKGKLNRKSLPKPMVDYRYEAASGWTRSSPFRVIDIGQKTEELSSIFFKRKIYGYFFEIFGSSF
jgi:hypothetical protein